MNSVATALFEVTAKHSSAQLVSNFYRDTRASPEYKGYP
jgi:hypothetical protein